MSGSVTKANGDEVWLDDSCQQGAAIYLPEGPDYYTSKGNRASSNSKNATLLWQQILVAILSFFTWW